MKIKENLLKNSLENLDKLLLPNNLKDNLLKLYRSAIKGFLPDQKCLRSFVCNPLKSHLRLQCTMKRIDNEKDNNNSPTTTGGAIYVLYLEYLGGLIPLLTAKRISKICPDFIIYDPQIKINDLLLKSSLTKLNSPIKKYFLLLKSRSNTFENISTIERQLNNSRSNLIINRNSIYVAQTDLNNNQRNFPTTKNNSNWNSDNDSNDEDEENTNIVQEKQSKKGNVRRIHSVSYPMGGH
jgi:hypothetical protein